MLIMYSCYLLQGMIFENSQIDCCIEMRSGILRRMTEVYQHYSYLLILRERMECVFVSTKVMRKTIWLASMVPFSCLGYWMTLRKLIQLPENIGLKFWRMEKYSRKGQNR